MHKLIYRIGGVNILKDKIIITGNIGDDSISIINLDYPYNVDTYNLKSLKFDVDKDIMNLPKNKFGPRDFCVNYNGNILILNAYDESLMTLDLDNKVVVSMIKLGRFPICMKLFDGKIYILNCDSNSISILDEESYLVIEEIYLDEKPSDLQIDIKENKIYIANSNGGSISVLNIIDNKLETIKLTTQPIRLIIDDSCIFILSYINNGILNYSCMATLYKNTNKILSKSIKGIFLDFIKIDKDNFLLTNPEDGCLYNFNIVDGKLTKGIFLGGMPCRIVMDKNKNIYVTDLINNQVIIIDYKNKKIINKIDVGEDPQGIHLL